MLIKYLSVKRVSGLRAAINAFYLAGESPALGMASLPWVVISERGGGDES
jgi:hypothetical protein